MIQATSEFALTSAASESDRASMEDLDISQAADKLQDLAHGALLRGDITFLTDESGRRIAAVVPVPVAEHALRLRAEVETVEVGSPA